MPHDKKDPQDPASKKRPALPANVESPHLGHVAIIETLPGELGHPNLVGTATVLDWGLNELWHGPANQALRFILAHAFQTHPHLSAQRHRLALLHFDARHILDTQGYLHLAEADEHIDRLLAGGSAAWPPWVIEILRDKNGYREWLPELLECLVRARLARGEGDAVLLRRLLVEIESLLRHLPEILRYQPGQTPAELLHKVLSHE